MKVITTLLMAAGLALAAAPAAPIAPSTVDSQRLAAEKARREYYQLLAQQAELKAKTDAKGQEALQLINSLQLACTGDDSKNPKGSFDGDTLACNKDKK